MSDGRDDEYEKIGQYPLIKQLGKGGMGSVWYSEHPYLKIPCAIKILDAKLAGKNPSFVQRFVLEGKLAAAINHPNVVKVFDADYENDQFYLVLEYVDGCDVKKLAEDRGGCLPLEEVLEIAFSIGSALKEAYENHQIIHRDIKPENILVNSEGLLKLADLGIGKKISEEEEFNLTMTGIAMGTAYYISPEQAMDSKHIDHRSDIYSLGGTLFKILTGEYPFQARTPAAMMMKHANVQPPNPQTIKPELPDSICAVVLKMLEKKPENRYNTYDEFLQDIDAIRLHNAPVESLTCTMPGINPQEAPGTAPETEPAPAKKKVHFSKKAQKHAEEMSHTVQRKSPIKKSPNNSTRVIAIAAVVLIVLCGAIFAFSRGVGNDNLPESDTEVAKKEKRVKSEKKKKRSSAAAAFAGTESPKTEIVKAEENEVNFEEKFIKDLEKKLSESNNAPVSIKDYVMDGEKLTALDLNNNSNLKNLKALKGLPLTYLNLNNCPNLESLNGIQGSELYELSIISSSSMKLNNLEALKNLPLHKLKVSNMPGLSYLDPLAQTNLESLQIINCPKIKSIKPLSGNKELASLEISNSTPGELRDLRGLERLPLKSLILENCPQVKTLRPIMDCPLNELTLRNCGVTDSELEMLYEIPLNRVDTGNPDFDNEYWAFIENGRQREKKNDLVAKAESIFESKGPTPASFSNQPPPDKGFMDNRPYGNAEVMTAHDGSLYIDGKKYADIKAGKLLSIPKLQAGRISYSLKNENVEIEGKWEIHPEKTSKVYIPNSKLAFDSSGFSSTLAKKYFAKRVDSKAINNKDMNKALIDSFKWLNEQSQEFGGWGDDENREGLTAIATLALLTDRNNIFNSNAEALDKGINILKESIMRNHDGRFEEYPIVVLALLEAYALTKNKDLQKPIAKGVQNILKSQSRSGAFDPYSPDAYEHHLFYSPWAFEVLKAAYLSGVYSKDCKKALTAGSKSLASLYQRDSREGQYYRYSFFEEEGPAFHEGPGGPPPRRGGGPGGPGPRGGEPDDEGMDPIELMRASGTFSLLTAGYRGSKLTPSLQYMARKDMDEISYRNRRLTMPLLTWYFSTQAMYNSSSMSWNKWKSAMFTEILKNHDRGYWLPVNGDAVDFFDGNREDARIYSTCMAILILSTEKRYLPYKSLP